MMGNSIPENMFAPCGMDCAVCYVRLKKKKACEGCRGADTAQPEHCRKCAIKDCAFSKGFGFCFECTEFPCQTIKRLDKSYRERYGVSLIENGRAAADYGLGVFMEQERARWECVECGGVVSLHDGFCSECGKVYRAKI